MRFLLYYCFALGTYLLLHKWDDRSGKFKIVPTLFMKNEDSTPTLCLIPSNHTSTTKINNFPIAFGPNRGMKHGMESILIISSRQE